VAEVEATLAEHPALKHVVVTVSEDTPGGLRLIAYYVARHQPAPTVTALREFVAATLPPYMVPSTFVELSEFPMTPRGKVNRRGLPDPGKERPRLNTPFVQPRTPIEKTLTQIWAGVLRLTSVGIRDDFFELGGHSLAATRIVSQVIKHVQLELPVNALFQSRTIAAMAAVIAEHQGKKLGETELDRILAQLESLSDEEAEQMVPSADEVDAARH
jgi:acyl carrier protein